MRTTNTFGIQIIIRINKLKENLAPIYCRVTVDSHRVEISLNNWLFRLLTQGKQQTKNLWAIL